MSDEAPRSFAVLLHEIGDGALLAHLSAELHDMATKCHDFALSEGADGRGELTLKLKLRVIKNGTASLSTDVTTKAPRAKLPPAGLWISKGGNLLTENPRQTALKFREVKAPDAREGAPLATIPERELPQRAPRAVLNFTEPAPKEAAES